MNQVDRAAETTPGDRDFRVRLLRSSAKALTLASFFAIVCCVALSSAAPPADKTAGKSGEHGASGTKEAADDQDAGNDGDEAPGANENPFPRRVKAPELDGGTGWLNTSSEITLKDLRGKVVLLDFWTFCCINCMHVLPDLAYLEKKYDRQLVVIGVHSAKFANEKESENIRRAIVRYEISHPVINDSEMTVWNKFGVRSWPTIVLIDPEGYYCGNLAGEGNREPFDNAIKKLVAYHKAKGTLDETPVRFDLEREKSAATPLKFPGKLLADDLGRRLFIADSNHNRIVVSSLEGKLLETIGSGAIGKLDGGYDKASFDHPQGLALAGQKLYVADTENHLIREIDLIERIVRTVAGTGQQGHSLRGGDALKTPLNSPWDLALLQGKLFIAMAGQHQLWEFDPRQETVAPHAGSGREDVLNGPLDRAAMAQPSGIATDGKELFVVDSEGSAVRRVSANSTGGIETIAGTSNLQRGQSLFAFGDREGIGPEARFQHPLGIAWASGALYVADTYNHRIKQVDPATGEVRNLLGDGKSGDRDAPPRFYEPGGLSVAGDELFIADTNNHQIRVADLRSGKVRTLSIDGLAPPLPPKSSPGDDADRKAAVRVPLQQIVSGESLNFEAALRIPKSYKLNRLAPLTYRLTAAAEQSLVAADQLGERRELELPSKNDRVLFSVPLAARTGKAELYVTISYGYCRDGEGGLCKLATLSWLVPVEVSAGVKGTVIKLGAEE